MLSALLSMINDETDKELVRSLYEANEQLMYNVAYNILHNRTDAEDAVQDSFVSVINHLEKIREIDCNETRFYLVIVVKNISLNMLKKKQRHPAVDIDEVFDAKSDENTEEEIISKVSSDEIKRALVIFLDNGDLLSVFCGIDAFYLAVRGFHELAAVREPCSCQVRYSGHIPNILVF